MSNKAEIASSKAFEEIAAKYGVSVYALALAWEMKTSDSVLPIPGATRAASILDCVSALDVNLTSDDFEYLNQHLPQQVDVSDELTPKPPHRQ
jgi:aryl-alcohol dehydrogenase-like predicted oxidoreductase